MFGNTRIRICNGLIILIQGDFYIRTSYITYITLTGTSVSKHRTLAMVFFGCKLELLLIFETNRLG